MSLTLNKDLSSTWTIHTSRMDAVAVENLIKIYNIEPSAYMLRGLCLSRYIVGVHPVNVLSEIIGKKPDVVMSGGCVESYDKVEFGNECMMMQSGDKQKSDHKNVYADGGDEIVRPSVMPNDENGGRRIYAVSKSCLYNKAEDGYMVCFDSTDAITVYYIDSVEGADQRARDIIKEFRKRTMSVAREKVEMFIICQSSGGYYLQNMEIRPNVKYDIDDLYNDDFKPIHNNITKFLKSDRSGLIILHGKPGSGKTSYIRRLVKSEDYVKFVYMPCDLVSNMSAPNMASFMSMELQDSVLIIEDCEQLLASRESSSSSPGIVNLLNIADGMFGDTLSIKIICTFNENIDDIGIDSALLRKGRLISRYEFKELDKDKTVKLLTKIGKPVDKDQEGLVLSDIFYKNEDNNGVDHEKEESTKPVYF